MLFAIFLSCTWNNLDKESSDEDSTLVDEPLSPIDFLKIEEEVLGEICFLREFLYCYPQVYL